MGFIIRSDKQNLGYIHGCASGLSRMLLGSSVEHALREDVGAAGCAEATTKT